MSIPLRIVTKAELAGDAEWEPGMMWRYPPGDDPDRECWWIVLPNAKPDAPGYARNIVWLTTQRASAPPHDRWNVSGTPPQLTVTPSIDVECWVVRDGQSVREGSYWHGWITNGVLDPA